MIVYFIKILKFLKGPTHRVSRATRWAFILSLFVIGEITSAHLNNLYLSWWIKSLIFLWIVMILSLGIALTTEIIIQSLIKQIIKNGYSDKIIIYGDLLWLNNNWDLEGYNLMLESLAYHCHESIELSCMLEEKLKYEPLLRCKIAMAYLIRFQKEIPWEMKGYSHYIDLLYFQGKHIGRYLKKDTIGYFKEQNFLYYVDNEIIYRKLWGKYCHIIMKEYRVYLDSEEFLFFNVYIPNRLDITLDTLRYILNTYKKGIMPKFTKSVFESLLNNPIYSDYGEKRIKILYSRPIPKNFYELYEFKIQFSNMKQVLKKPKEWSMILKVLNKVKNNFDIPINNQIRFLNNYTHGIYSFKIPKNLAELNLVGEMMNNCLKSKHIVSDLNFYILISKRGRPYAVANFTRSYNLEIKKRNNEIIDHKEAEELFSVIHKELKENSNL